MIACFNCGTVPAFRDRGWEPWDCECGILWATDSVIVFGEDENFQIFVRDGAAQTLRRGERVRTFNTGLKDFFEAILVHEVLGS